MKQKQKLKLLLLSMLLIWTTDSLVAQCSNEALAKSCNHSHAKDLDFIPNKNQFHENVLFRTSIGGLNKLYLESSGFTYLFHSDDEVNELHDLTLENESSQEIEHIIPAHAYRVHFKNALTATDIKGDGKKGHHYNFFLGNDRSKWAGEVAAFGKIHYQELYKGIDLEAYSKNGQFKYDFIVKPGSNPDLIALEFEGVDGLTIEDGHLKIQTSVIQVIEQKPFAYQIKEGEQCPVDCNYILDGNTMRFEFPRSYDLSYELIIDPTVVAATLSGTGSTVYGHTATFDDNDNIYAGGRCYGSNYPTSSGAFQENFGGGSVDMCISKYSPDGSSLIFATYIGGGANDYPHSMIVDENEQLIVYGSTFSNDFPVSANAFQSTSGAGSDIAITKFTTTGSNIVGSTYVGGNANDGSNNSSEFTNYGERYRGEVNIDPAGNIYIASFSSSLDFPTTAGAYQTAKGDDQDGVVIKMNPDLSAMAWGTFLGSGDGDTAGGIRVGDDGNIYVIGTAGNNDFPLSAGGYQSAWPGGEESAYVAVLDPSGSNMLYGTFWGTSSNEHGYFLDLDLSGNVHIYGQTTGTSIPITPGTYVSNPGSKQYIAAFTPSLENLLYSTVIGTGSSDFNFVPVAFMVDRCEKIYLSGYQADANLPVTSDAFSTSPGTFYLAVLEPMATGLIFGSYYGASRHVDGGTSRFSKKGIVYQAVCSGSSSTLNTLSNAWADDQDTSWDLGVFKIDFEQAILVSEAAASPSATGCAPFSVDFEFTGQNSSDFFWDFGVDSATSVLENPSYTFDEPGTYTVTLVASLNGISCDQTDTTFLEIFVFEDVEEDLELSVCEGMTVEYDGMTLEGGDVEIVSFDSASGCDSIVTVTVVELPIEESELTIPICEGASVEYEGVELSSGDSEDFTFTAMNGCDSIVTVNVSGLPILESELSIPTCAGTTVEYEGVELAIGEMQSFTFTATDGCDSIVTVSVNGLSALESELTIPTCEGTSVEYEGVDLAIGEMEAFTFTAINGCDSIVTVSVSGLPILESAIMIPTCEGTIVEYEGVNLSIGDEQAFSFTAANGCDSIVTVSISGLLDSESALTLPACAGTTIEYEGVELSIGDEQAFTFTAANGCDSIVTVSVNGLLNSASALAIPTCEGTTVEYEGVDLSIGDVEAFTFTAANGCDSIVTVSINGLLNSESAIAIPTCEGTTIEYEGIDLSIGDIEAFTFTAANGCDSIVTVSINGLLNSASALAIPTCEGTTIEYEGIDLSIGDIEAFTFTAANGCDSIVTVNVTELLSSTSAITIPTCVGTTVEYDGVDLSIGDVEAFAFTAANGCDSIVTVSINGLLNSEGAIAIPICEGSTVEYEGVDLSIGDVEAFTFTAANGCDSIVTVSISGLFIQESSLTIPTCEGTAIEYEGVELSSGDIQAFTFIGANGCDSIVTVAISALPVFESELNIPTCEGTSVEYEGVELSSGETEAFTFTAVNGCDSIVVVSVIGLPVFETALTIPTCEGTTVFYESVELSGGDVEDFMFTAANGCDSIVTVSVATLFASNEFVDLESCEGTSINYNGQDIEAGETELFVLTAANGCDSIVTVFVAPAPLSSTSLDLYACEGTTVNYNGTDLNVGDEMDFVFVAANSCDSMVTVFVNSLAPSYNSIELVACEGDFVLYDGVALNPGDAMDFTFVGANTCDSIVTVLVSSYTLDVAVNSLDATCFGGEDGTITVTSSTPELTYSLDGINYTNNSQFSNLAAGVYTVYVEDQNACVYDFEVQVDQPLPLALLLPEDVEIQLGDSVVIEPLTNIGTGEIVNYQWLPSIYLNCDTCEVATSTPPRDISYELTIVDENGCIARDDINIFLDFEPKVYIPNSFSPNGDGFNDFFTIYGNKDVEMIEVLNVFSRWGEHIFNTKDIPPNDELLGWNGTLKGEAMNPGVFVFWARVRMKDGRTEFFKGDVSLFR